VHWATLADNDSGGRLMPRYCSGRPKQAGELVMLRTLSTLVARHPLNVTNLVLVDFVVLTD